MAKRKIRWLTNGQGPLKSQGERFWITPAFPIKAKTLVCLDGKDLYTDESRVRLLDRQSMEGRTSYLCLSQDDAKDLAEDIVMDLGCLAVKENH